VKPDESHFYISSFHNGRKQKSKVKPRLVVLSSKLVKTGLLQLVLQIVHSHDSGDPKVTELKKTLLQTNQRGMQKNLTL
jgi:hypothetical protein